MSEKKTYKVIYVDNNPFEVRPQKSTITMTTTWSIAQIKKEAPNHAPKGMHFLKVELKEEE